MSNFSITAITVSCEIANKSYGDGNSRFASFTARVPEGAEGLALTDGDQVISDSIEMYLNAWQTLMQTRYATGDINGNTYKEQTAAFLVRIEKIRALYARIKGKTIAELEQFLDGLEAKDGSQ